MPYDTTKTGYFVQEVSRKAVIAKFDQDHVSSEDGAVLPKACDEKLKLSTTLAWRVPIALGYLPQRRLAHRAPASKQQVEHQQPDKNRERRVHGPAAAGEHRYRSASAVGPEIIADLGPDYLRASLIIPISPLV